MCPSVVVMGFFKLNFPVDQQLVVQSALGAKDIVQAKYACVMCAYGKILTIIFMVLPGVVARILYTGGGQVGDRWGTGG